MQYSFLSEYPLLRFALGFGDEFESEAIGVVIVFKWVLEGDEFVVVSSEEVDVGVESAFVFLKFPLKLLAFELHLFLEILHQQFHLNL